MARASNPRFLFAVDWHIMSARRRTTRGDSRGGRMANEEHLVILKQGVEAWHK